LLLSEHKHCDNAATNSNSEIARSRTVGSLRGSVGMGTKEDELSTGRVWAAGFHHVTALLAWRAFWNLWTISLIFQIFFGPRSTAHNWNSGYGDPSVHSPKDDQTKHTKLHTPQVMS